MGYVPIDKRSKKARKEWYSSQRRDGYGHDNVTRVIPNGKAYRRERIQYDFQ